MASINGYPHVEMHVRDDSIYIPSDTEILPLARPLYMMKCARGPIGVPVWCPQYSDAVRVFGADTFNKRSKFFSENSYFLLKTFPFNGAFIMRVADTAATNARITIEVGLSATDTITGLPTAKIPQWKRDQNGQFMLELTGAKIPVNEQGLDPDELASKNTLIADAKAKVAAAQKAIDDGEEGAQAAMDQLVRDGIVALSQEEILEFEQATLDGYKIAWRAVQRPSVNDKRPLGTNATIRTDNFTWYPLMDIVASNPGSWGSCYGVKLFFDPNINTLAGTVTNGAATFSFAPVELLQDATMPTPVVDQYGVDTVTGVLKPDVVDADTEVDLTLKARVARAYAGRQALPLKFTYFSDNWNIVGKEIMKAELAVREQASVIYPELEQIQIETVPSTTYSRTADTERDMSKTYYVQTGTDEWIVAPADCFKPDGSFDPDREYWEKDPDTVVYGVRSFVDDLLGETTVESDGTYGAFTPATDDSLGESVGYMTNIASLTDYQGIPFFASEILESTDDLITGDNLLDATDIVTPTSDQPMFLAGGLDGHLEDWYIEEYIRAQIRSCIAGTQDYLNDYWHCPYNFIYDTGYTLKTKKAIIDMTVARDNMIAVISSQITWKKNAADIADPVANSRMDDESIAASLRAYALLMREDVENATGACRTIIFTAAGKTSDHDDKWVPYTLWYALKNAEYLNKPYIDQEPKELPYSSVECFTQTSWTAAQEETKSRVWNSGVNYVQYYNMTGIHFASVRSVYWYETSILVDAGAVCALCFTKDVIRRSWSTWAGSTRRASELNKLITEDIDSRELYMLHDKFRHKVRVYQDSEDMKLGFQRHVDVELWAAGQNRVWKATIICKREGYNDQENS